MAESGDTSTTAETPEGSTVPVVCKFYLESKCRFGGECLNLHPVIKDQLVIQSNQLKKNVGARNKSSNKTLEQETERIILEKKPPMKTARDVRNRIQWDKSLDAACYTIGYLDRFLGVIEEQFNAFTWEDLGSLDPTVLAIPEHRIQYFKYRDFKVWDKHQRLDIIFGSTGSQETIYEVMDRVDKTLIDVPGNGDEEQEPKVESSRPTCEDSVQINSNCNGEKHVKSTHFISMRITDPDTLLNLEQFQQQLQKEFPVLRTWDVIPPPLLHMTVAVLNLSSPAETSLCIRTFLKARDELLEKIGRSKIEILIDSIGHFNNKTIFAKVLCNYKFHELTEHLNSILTSAGITVITESGFIPHVTLLRSSRKSELFTNANVGLAVHSEHFFGNHAVEQLTLASVGGAQRDEDQFFKRLGEIDLITAF